MCADLVLAGTRRVVEAMNKQVGQEDHPFHLAQPYFFREWVIHSDILLFSQTTKPWNSQDGEEGEGTERA